MLYFVVLSLLIANLMAPVNSYNFKDHEEGSCGQYTPQADFNMDLYSKADFPYISAGSKYQLYLMTNSVPNREITSEENFSHNACLHRSRNFTSGVIHLFAFGLGDVENFQIKLSDENGVMDVVCLDHPEQDVFRETVTLTDYESFALFAVCWKNTQQRGWGVISSKPTLDANTQLLISEHVMSLGFDPAKFVFFSGDSCGEK